MNGYRLSDFCKRVIARTILVWALPFVFFAHAYAGESGERIGLTYDASAEVHASYLWRGLYAGGPSLQVSADVGYGGAYFTAWFNVGASDIRFTKFQPELDLLLGFKRWGLNVFLLYIHNFDCGFFDFHNHVGRGNRFEIDASYTISDRIPLRLLWATRLSAADGYVNAKGDTVFAYSSYAEVSYTWRLQDQWSIYAAVGVTPWRSCYTGYERNWALQNIELRLRKDFDVAPRCGMMLQGQVAVSPMNALQPINLNITYGVYLK